MEREFSSCGRLCGDGLRVGLWFATGPGEKDGADIETDEDIKSAWSGYDPPHAVG